MESMKPEDRKELVDEHGEETVAEYERLAGLQFARDPAAKLSPQDMADESALESLSALLFEEDDSVPSLNKEFFETVKLLNAKIAEAVQALKEVDKLALKMGVPTLVDSQYMEDVLSDNQDSDEVRAKLGHIDVSELERAIESLGWSTSSSYC